MFVTQYFATAFATDFNNHFILIIFYTFHHCLICTDKYVSFEQIFILTFWSRNLVPAYTSTSLLTRRSISLFISLFLGFFVSKIARKRL